MQISVFRGCVDPVMLDKSCDPDGPITLTEVKHMNLIFSAVETIPSPWPRSGPAPGAGSSPVKLSVVSIFPYLASWG